MSTLRETLEGLHVTPDVIERWRASAVALYVSGHCSHQTFKRRMACYDLYLELLACPSDNS